MPPDAVVVDLETILESMAVGFVTLSAAWRITRVNAAAASMLGRPAVDLVGRDLWEEFPGAREIEFGHVYERVMATREPESFDAWYPGIRVWFELRVHPGPAGGLAVFFLDITARRLAEQRLGLLARVGEVLAVVDDPDVALAKLARVVLPDLADWCVVTVRDDGGGLRDVGWAHRDLARTDQVAAYAAAQSRTMSPTSPVATTLRTGVPTVLTTVHDDRIPLALPDPQVAAMIRGLDPSGVVVVPLVAHGKTLGVLLLVTTPGRGSHTAAEIETAVEVGRRVGTALDAARTAQRGRRLAESVQRSLLTVADPQPGLTVATRYRPAFVDRQVGGDWYDAFTLPSGSTVVAIGDVMGHDIAALAAMAQLRNFMRAAAWSLRHSPAEVLAATDDVSFGLGPATVATAVLADLRVSDLDGAADLRWSNAGHLPPAVLSADGEVTWLREDHTDLPLGVERAAVRRDHHHPLASGSTLLLFTDGLVERRDRDIDAGLALLETAMRRHAGEDLGRLLDGVVADLTADVRHADDIALLAVRVGSSSVPTTPAAGSPDAGSPVEGVFTVPLPAGPIAPAVARHHVTEQATHLRREQLDDALLLVSEVAGNAIRHGRPPHTLAILAGVESVWAGVTDTDPVTPLLPAHRPAAQRPSGRGLLIIDGLADEWGVKPLAPGPGKTVWFRVGVDDPDRSG